MPRSHFYFFDKKIYSETIDYQKHIGEICNLRTKWIKYWKDNKLDFVITPGAGCQAFPHGKSELLGLVCAYTFIWNILDHAVGSMPITTVRENEQVYQSRINDMITT